MLVGNVQVAAMCERMQQIFVQTRAGFEVMELVGGEQRGLQERAEEASRLGRIQGGCWGRLETIWFAFIPESSLC